jgi:hypothetical protein
MALLMGITIPAGLDIIYNKTLKMYDISVLCNVGKNPRWFPRAKLVTLREVTYLFNIAYAWSFFSVEEKAAWTAAADIIGQHGYNLFVQDKSYRIKNAIGGNATPSIYHQYLVGHLNVQNPANEALIAQYNAFRVNFPASFELCFKTDLTADGADPYARLKFTWTRYTSGQNIENVETIEFPLSQAWTKETKNITQLGGIRGKWRLELELHDVTGDIWFDNVIVLYSSEIKTSDPYCEDVVRWWKGVSLPAGVTLETVYPQGGAL